MVYLQYLEPRTLSLIPSFGCTSTERSNPVSNFSFVKSHPYHVACMTFTVAEGRQSQLAATPFYEVLPFRRTLEALLKYRYGEYKPAVPKPPVCFHVCGESRACVEERYELGFPGTNFFNENEQFTEMFKASCLHRPRVWVDFKMDEIFVVGADDVMGDLRTVRGDVFLLQILERHVRMDVERIQRLAVAEHWSTEPDGALNEGLSLTLTAFKSLKRLKVYHSYVEKGLGDVWHVWDEETSDDSDDSDEEVRELRVDILEVLEEQKAHDDG